MAKVRTPNPTSEHTRRRAAIDPETRENQLVSYAYNLAEQRLLDGTASSQEVVHFLKMGSAKHKREMEKLEEENKLLRAKTEQLASMKNIEALYVDAIAAMREYQGKGEPEDYDDYDDGYDEDRY